MEQTKSAPNEGVMGALCDQQARQQLSLTTDYTIVALAQGPVDYVPFDSIQETLDEQCTDEDCFGDLLNPDEVAQRLEPARVALHLPQGFFLVTLADANGDRVTGVVALLHQ